MQFPMVSTDYPKERKELEKKIRDVREQIVREIEKKHFLGLDRRVRQVQKQLHILGRI